MKTKDSNFKMNFSKDLREDLKISVELIKPNTDRVIVKPNGSINSDNTSYFQEHMEKLIDDGFKDIVFNMSNTVYVSAVGIGSFIHLFESVKKIGGSIVLTNMQTQVIEVFQLPGFDKYFSLNTDDSSAF